MSLLRFSWAFFVVLVIALSETTSSIIENKALVGSTLGDIDGGVGFLGIVMLAFFGFFIWFIVSNVQKTSRKKECLRGDDENGLLEVKVPMLEYEELMLATNDLSSILGKGGSCCVFKGKLRGGTCVAVKRTMEREFQAEVAAIGCKPVHHTNVVHLLGYCIVPKLGSRFLVYELIQNGSLDHWIFPRKQDRNQSAACLPWKLRYKVAIDVAKGLSYLHNMRILHLDVKPENILLDSNFRALVSDFGMSKLMGEKDLSIVFDKVRGTREYLAPEWILQNRVSPKTDVYSYGMLLLEIIGGQRNIKKNDDDMKNWEYSPKTVFEKMRAGKLLEVVDKRMMEGETVDENEVRRLVYVALWCVQEKVKLRPKMAQVVDILEGRLPVDEPPETEMFFFDLLLINSEKKHGQNRLSATAFQISR